MSSETFTFRASDFANPEAAARRMTRVVAALREDLAVRRRLVDVTFTTDASGVATPITLKSPTWSVKGVASVYQWDLTGNAATFFRISFHYDSAGQLVVNVFSGDVSPSRSYALRLELTGE